METIGKTAGNSQSTAAMTGSGIHQAIDQLSEATRPAVSRAASGAHRLVDRVVGSSNRAAQHLQETGTWLKDTEQRLVGASSGYVREHPFRSVGIALAAGFLVSRLVAASRASASERKFAGSDQKAANDTESGGML